MTLWIPTESDLDVYVAIAGEVGAHRVLDVGCGNGAVALLLAERGMEVTGLDPAKASLDVARAKPGAEQVRWIHGDASALPGLHAELATMTGNVAQAVVEPTDWGRDAARRIRRPAARRVSRVRVSRSCLPRLAGVEPG